jgi:hypothetical protein
MHTILAPDVRAGAIKVARGLILSLAKVGRARNMKRVKT